MADTRRRILDTARDLFNAHGLNRVGVRDIARAVGMSPGNLAYHFPTKDDLVAALVLELHDLNKRTVFSELPATFSLVTLYRAAVGAMRNMLVFRFVLLSYVDAVRASPELRELDAKLWAGRRERYDAMIELLARNGYVRGRAIAPRAATLYEIAEMISSGWLGAAALRTNLRDEGAIILHYAKLGMALLEPFTTPRGARQMRRILDGGYDGQDPHGND